MGKGEENMYTIKNMYITKRANTRPGWRQQAPKAIVLHWTANPGGTALNHYNYFNNGAGGNYASAHYFVDKDNIVCIIPDNEVAFHANESGYSKVGYLNGLWTPGVNYKGNANSGSIGIEMCLERDGKYHPETLKKTWWLTAHLLKKHGLGLDRIETHNRITGKACPRDFLGTIGRQKIIDNTRPFFSGTVQPPQPKPEYGKGSLGEIEIVKSTMSYKAPDGKQAIKGLAVGQRFYYYEATEYWTRIGNEYVATGNVKFLSGPGAPKPKPIEEDNYMKLNNTQAEELSNIFKQAREKGLFKSDQHEKDVLAGKMDRDKAIYLVALIAAGKRHE